MPGAEDARGPGESDRNDPPDRPDELRAVAGYRLLRQIGEGGMSTVYLSYDVPGRRAVAVKLLADHLACQREFVNRFYREARLSRLVQHPNIVRGYAAGYDPGANKHYIVLEFIDGPSAHTALTRLGRLPVGIAVKIGIDIARALDFLHAHNYVHRDVKPDNVLLHPDGVAKLADLGLTKRLSGDTHLTSVNLGVGTSYYMPYEQAMNAALVDGRSDIFALGATLYHLLTGQVPFQGATHEEIIREKQHNAFRPVRELNPEVPEALAAIIAATLARDPRVRYQSAAELAAALEATGLATEIPPFPAGTTAGEQTTDDASALDAPTRADFVLRDGTPSPAQDPAERTDVLPPGIPSPVPPPPDPPPAEQPRFPSLAVTGLLLALGVFAGWCRSAGPCPGPATPPAAQSAVKQAGGLPPADPQ